MDYFKKALILTGDAFQFNFSEKNLDVMDTYIRLPIFLRMIRRFHYIVKLPCKYIWYDVWKHNLEQYDFIIVDDALFDVEVFGYIRKKNPTCRLIFWHFGIISTKRDLKLDGEKLKCEEWSFDKDDCVKYKLKYNIQFYNQEKATVSNDEKFDVFFIGVNKNRLKSLMELREKLEKKNLVTKFIVLKDKTKVLLEKKQYITNRWIPYDEVIDYVKKSKCILEINQIGQKGLTRRTLEALFYSKKLITNNKDIITYDFYNQSNIFIIGVDNFAHIDKFLKTSYQKIDGKIIYQYSYKQWLKNFFEQPNGLR